MGGTFLFVHGIKFRLLSVPFYPALLVIRELDVYVKPSTHQGRYPYRRRVVKIIQTSRLGDRRVFRFVAHYGA